MNFGNKKEKFILGVVKGGNKKKMPAEFLSNLSTIEWVIAVAGAILLILGLTGSGKSKTTGKTFLWLGIAGLAVVFVIPMLGFDLLGGLGGVQPATIIQPTGGAIIQPTGDLTVCDLGTSTTVTLSAVNKFTDVATGGTHAYRIGNGPINTVADASTFSASPLQILKILYGNESDGSYFGNTAEVKIPCQSTFNPASDTPDFTAHRLGQNGTITFSVFNQDGNVINGNTENETLGAGDTVSLKIDINGQNQREFSNGGVFILEVNKSDYDEENIFIDFPTLGGRLVKVSTPNVHSLTSVDNIALAFDVGPISGATLHTGTIYLDVDANNNPGDINDPVLTFRPKDYFRNEDTGSSFDGPAVEDEDNVATFGHVTSTTIHVD